MDSDVQNSLSFLEQHLFIRSWLSVRLPLQYLLNYPDLRPSPACLPERFGRPVHDNTIKPGPERTIRIKLSNVVIDGKKGICYNILGHLTALGNDIGSSKSAELMELYKGFKTFDVSLLKLIYGSLLLAHIELPTFRFIPNASVASILDLTFYFAFKKSTVF